jgi:DNA-directed RNA polymerase subunit M/transcription elongation factor TFIIS
MESDLSNINIESFNDNLDKYSSVKKASIFGDLFFFDEFANTYPQNLYNALNTNINRIDTITIFCKFIKDMDLSNKIEAGIYEFTLSYIFKNDMDYDFLVPVYNDKVAELLLSFDKKSEIHNKLLLKKLKNSELDAQEIAFLKPQEIHPENWKTELEKKAKIEYKKTHMAATDMYKCYECGERKCIMYQLQTRSADEGMTNFCKCLVCYNTFKVG